MGHAHGPMTAGGRDRVWRRVGALAVGAWIALTAPSHPRMNVPRQVLEPIWVVAGEGRGTPAADASTAYFLSRRHEVVAIDVLTGAERWRTHTASAGAETMGSRVVRAGDAIIAGDYAVVAFDRRTGRLRWRFAPETGYGPGIYLGGASGGDVYAGSAGGYAHAIAVESGASRWSARVAADDTATTVYAPVASADVVVAGFTVFSQPPRGGVVALDRETGRERWRHRFPAWATPAAPTGAAGEPVFVDQWVVASSRDGTIFGLDRATGAVRWVIPSTPRADGRPAQEQDFRPVVQVGRALVAGSLRGDVAAYDIDTRRRRWQRAPVAASVAFELTADEDTVYVPYLSGHLVALDAGNGVERWRVGGPAMGLTWSPLVYPARLLVAGSGAGFLAFER